MYGNYDDYYTFVCPGVQMMINFLWNPAHSKLKSKNSNIKNYNHKYTLSLFCVLNLRKKLEDRCWLRGIK